MAFLSVCTAVYDYAPQSEGELLLREGELVYILEKSEEDDWWKAKKRAPSDEEEEPVGLIPNNYVEEVGTRAHTWALHQTLPHNSISLMPPSTVFMADRSTAYRHNLPI